MTENKTIPYVEVREHDTQYLVFSKENMSDEDYQLLMAVVMARRELVERWREVTAPLVNQHWDRHEKVYDLIDKLQPRVLYVQNYEDID